MPIARWGERKEPPEILGTFFVPFPDTINNKGIRGNTVIYIIYSSVTVSLLHNVYWYTQSGFR